METLVEKMPIKLRKLQLFKIYIFCNSKKLKVNTSTPFSPILLVKPFRLLEPFVLFM